MENQDDIELDLEIRTIMWEIKQKMFQEWNKQQKRGPEKEDKLENNLKIFSEEILMESKDDIELDLEIQAIMWEGKMNMAKKLSDEKKKSQQNKSENKDN